jgi:hypothetical protein
VVGNVVQVFLALHAREVERQAGLSFEQPDPVFTPSPLEQRLRDASNPTINGDNGQTCTPS